MTITALPPAPSTSDPTTFDAKADALIAALPTFVTETNAVAVAMNLNSTTDTSASSVLIGTGAKTFTVTAGKSFQPGMYLVCADTAAPSTNSMYCQVTSYSGTTLVVNSLTVAGSGTKTAWVISQSAGGASGFAALAGLSTQDFAAKKLTLGAGALIESEGAAVTAASSTNIWAGDGNTVHVTGNTGIADFATAPQAGAWMKVIFDGTPLLTQSANLNLNAGGANIQIAAGDFALVYADTTTQMDVFVVKKDGTAVVVSAPATGRLLGFTTITATNATWTPNASTTKIVTCVVGGGGAGAGGNGSYIYNNVYGGMSGEEKWDVSTSVSGTYAATIGAGGTGVSAAAGNSGSPSSFIGTGLSVTAQGGLGGATDSAAPLSQGVCSNGESRRGRGGARAIDTTGGAAAANSGAGGGAAGTTAAINRTGGAGGSGIIYVWEFT